MKKIVLFFAVLLSTSGFAQDAAIKKTIEDFFAAFHARDTVALKATFSSQLVLQSVAEGKDGAKLTTDSVVGFLKSIGSVPPEFSFEERLLSWKISQDGAMAQVWTPYEFYIDGKLSHQGVNSFALFNDGKSWKIVYCIDTRRRPK